MNRGRQGCGGNETNGHFFVMGFGISSDENKNQNIRIWILDTKRLLAFQIEFPNLLAPFLRRENHHGTHLFRTGTRNLLRRSRLLPDSHE